MVLIKSIFGARGFALFVILRKEGQQSKFQ